MCVFSVMMLCERRLKEIKKELLNSPPTSRTTLGRSFVASLFIKMIFFLQVAVREARLKEIKQELLNSQKLTSYFEDNPRDRQVLRHDKVTKNRLTF